MSTDQIVLFENLKKLIDDHNGDELVVNGQRSCYVIGRLGHVLVNRGSKGCDDLNEAVRELAWSQGLRLDPFYPSCGGVIANLGVRWHAIIGPVSSDEILFTMRILRFHDLDLSCFAGDPQDWSLLESAIAHKAPILIAGATGVGKTTFLVGLLKKYFLKDRVAIIESLSEIPTFSDSWIRLVSTPKHASGKGGFTLAEIAKETLRIRPEVLVVGELRGAEAEVFLDMSLSGHGGCLGTIHADSVDSAVKRLKRMIHGTPMELVTDFPVTVAVLGRSFDGEVRLKCVERVNLNT